MRWSLEPASSRDILGNSSHEHLTRHKNFSFCIDISLNHNSFDHWLSSASRCHYSTGWAATLRLEEITKRLLGARFPPGRQCTKETQTPGGDVNSVTTTWALIPVCTAWPAEPAWLVTRLPWARLTAQPLTPTPQPNLEFQVLSAEEMVLCLWTIFWFLLWLIFAPHFLQLCSYKLLNSHLLLHQTSTWTLRTGSGISFTWQQAACRDRDHAQPIIFMSLEYLSSKVKLSPRQS